MSRHTIYRQAAAQSAAEPPPADTGIGGDAAFPAPTAQPTRPGRGAANRIAATAAEQIARALTPRAVSAAAAARRQLRRVLRAIAKADRELAGIGGGGR